NGRSPIMWQMELVDHVTWCSTATRTNPAQKNAVSAPHQDQVINPPSTAGSTKVTVVHSTNIPLIRTMSLSANRSGANRSLLVTSSSNSQPMCACQKPLASAHGEVPNSHGECGSPSRSEKA